VLLRVQHDHRGQRRVVGPLAAARARAWLRSSPPWPCSPDPPPAAPRRRREPGRSGHGPRSTGRTTTAPTDGGARWRPPRRHRAAWRPVDLRAPARLPAHQSPPLSEPSEPSHCISGVSAAGARRPQPGQPCRRQNLLPLPARRPPTAGSFARTRPGSSPAIVAGPAPGAVAGMGAGSRPKSPGMARMVASGTIRARSPTKPGGIRRFRYEANGQECPDWFKIPQDLDPASAKWQMFLLGSGATIHA